MRSLQAEQFQLTCKGVKATLEAVPDTSPLRLTVDAPPHACCFCKFFFNVCETLTLVLSSIWAIRIPPPIPDFPILPLFTPRSV